MKQSLYKTCLDEGKLVIQKSTLEIRRLKCFKFVDAKSVLLLCDEYMFVVATGYNSWTFPPSPLMLEMKCQQKESKFNDGHVAVHVFPWFLFVECELHVHCRGKKPSLFFVSETGGVSYVFLFVENDLIPLCSWICGQLLTNV